MIPTLLLLAACAVPDEFGGGDIGDFDADPQAISGSEPDDDGARAGNLTATGGQGEIAVTHVGVWDRCCASWETATQVVDDDIGVTYTDVATETCDDECAWDFVYVIPDVPPGTWTVTARGVQATAEVQ